MEVNHIIKNKWVQASALSMVTGLGGAVAGYFLGQKRGQTQALDAIRAEQEAENERVKQLSFFDYGPLTENKQKPSITHPGVDWDKVKTQSPNNPVVQALAKEEERIDTRFPTEKVRYDLINEKLRPKEEIYIPMQTVEETPVVLTVDEPQALTVDQPQELTVDIDPVIINVFAHDDANWDYEHELSTRANGEPYIIHEEEYISDEMDFRQETLTFYAGDDIMVDSDDTPIYNYTGLMGELKFGHGSRDPNVVYIRNEVLHMEWEILLNPGLFAQEILGLEMERADENELNHSVQKFRRE